MHLKRECYYETFIPAAAEMGYEVSKEELDEIVDAESEDISEEELGKIAGGTSCLTAVTVISYTGLFR